MEFPYLTPMSRSFLYRQRKETEVLKRLMCRELHQGSICLTWSLKALLWWLQVPWKQQYLHASQFFHLAITGRPSQDHLFLFLVYPSRHTRIYSAAWDLGGRARPGAYYKALALPKQRCDARDLHSSRNDCFPVKGSSEGDHRLVRTLLLCRLDRPWQTSR